MAIVPPNKFSSSEDALIMLRQRVDMRCASFTNIVCNPFMHMEYTERLECGRCRLLIVGNEKTQCMISLSGKDACKSVGLPFLECQAYACFLLRMPKSPVKIKHPLRAKQGIDDASS